MENDEIKSGLAAGGLFKQLAVILLIGLSVYLSEGLHGFMPFLSLEAVVLVFGGTFLLTWAVYPVKEIFRPTGPAPLLYAAGCAVSMGALTAVLGAILMLASIDDISHFPGRMAYTLSGLFFALLLSEVVLAPLAARLAAGENPGGKSGPDPRSGAGKRMIISLLAVGVAAFSLLAALISLNSALCGPGRF